MRRRDFLTASATALAAASLLPSSARAAESTASSGPRQLFDLRTYKFASQEKQKAFAEFLEKAFVPAANRAGIKPVGLFQMTAKENPQLKLTEDPLEIWVFLPHDTFESFLGFEAKVAADNEYQNAGKDILNGVKANAAFARFDSMLLNAMVNFPRVAVPSQAPNRLFELRTYESPNAERAANKLDRFNAGEFAAFQRAGMPGVFFGGAIAGAGLPQLTYMVLHENPDDAKPHWDAFRKDAGWKQLSSQPQYKDNVSKIIDRYVRPLPGSQI
jgi:hypothetical protein